MCKGPQSNLGYGIKSQNHAVIWSQMFISSQSKLSMESKKFFNKSYQANWLKGGYEIKSQNYAVIWSQMLISSQSKLSMESKKLLYKSCKWEQPKEGHGIKSQNY